MINYLKFSSSCHCHSKRTERLHDHGTDNVYVLQCTVYYFSYLFVKAIKALVIVVPCTNLQRSFLYHSCILESAECTVYAWCKLFLHHPVWCMHCSCCRTLSFN
jgi:hypothetical protein